MADADQTDQQSNSSPLDSMFQISKACLTHMW